MAGLEGDEAQRKVALAAKQKAKIEACQKQAKIRRLGRNSGDAGPLFGDGSKDLFDAPRTHSAEQISAAAAEADLNPTAGQKEAGNYKMGHFPWSGPDIKIENAKGSTRSKTGPTAVAWSVVMPAHYGYIKQICSTGNQTSRFAVM